MHRARSLARALFHSAARTYASILATTCCIRTALSSYDLDFVHPHKYDFAASIASCDVGLPRQSMQATSSIHQHCEEAPFGQRVGSTRAFLVRGWGGNTRGAREKAGVRTGARARAQRQLSTREKAQRRPCSTSGWFAKPLEALLGLHSHWPPKTTDTSMTLSFLGRPYTAPRLDRPHGAAAEKEGLVWPAQFCESEGVRRRRRRRGRGGSVRSVCEPTNPAQPV
ncbi:hypothetical protein B0H14DRAFT_2867385, partial [Mycena olivaceomarginata]